jgi:hypothetical protein
MIAFVMSRDASLEEGLAYRGLGLTSRISRRPCCSIGVSSFFSILVSKLLATLA